MASDQRLTKNGLQPWLSRLSDLGMLPVLLLLCAVFSVLTYDEQHPRGDGAGWRLADAILRQVGPKARVIVVAEDSPTDEQFVAAFRARLGGSGATIAATVQGAQGDARHVLEIAIAERNRVDAIACTESTRLWFDSPEMKKRLASLGEPKLVVPPTFWWPNFLNRENLLNIASQIAVIGIIAIGMTVVIITGGIDLSVGSLIALSAVVATLLIRDGIHIHSRRLGIDFWMLGGELHATRTTMILSSLLGILACGLVGLFSGTMVTLFRLPSFIVTLAIMLSASGLAGRLTNSESVNGIPPSYVWLGRGADFLNIPNAVVLMLLLYVAAYVLMQRTVLGRYIYAVGGNPEAARLSGVPIFGTLLFAYILSGSLAGLGGIIMASQQNTGLFTYGTTYELYVIAAVVVGGTSLSGGEGTVMGTLIGAFIIGVIQNGMNLTGIQSETQKIVLGAVILGAVLLDKLKRGAWPWRGISAAGGD